MNDILKINSNAILNFPELRREFSPLQIYGQLPQFVRFSRVHCVYLPIRLPTGANGEQEEAKYLCKEFWQSLIQCGDLPPDMPEAEALLSFVALRSLSESFAQSSTSPVKHDSPEWQKARETVNGELKALCVGKKLEHILSSGKLGKDPGDAWKALQLLAICELAEMDAKKLSFAPPSVGETGAGRETPQPFPFAGNVPLAAGSAVCRFLYHQEDTLAPGEVIRTVRIDAKRGGNPQDSLRVELIREDTGQCVDSIRLLPGEFCYCTAAGDRVIRFLPGLSLSDELCLMRSGEESESISVIARGAEAWALDGEGVSCFAAGSGEDGFLLIQDGRLLSNFYRPAADFSKRLRFDLISRPVVEVTLNQEGYEILLEDGSVLADTSSDGATGRVSLNRGMRWCGADEPDRTEAALSESGESAAFFHRGEERGSVLFGGRGERFTLSREGARTLIRRLEDE